MEHTKTDSGADRFEIEVTQGGMTQGCCADSFRLPGPTGVYACSPICKPPILHTVREIQSISNIWARAQSFKKSQLEI